LTGSAQEGKQLVQTALDAVEQQLPTQRQLFVALLTTQAGLLRRIGLDDEAGVALEQASQHIQPEELEAKAAVLLQKGRMLHNQKDYAEATEQLAEALALAGQAGWRFGQRSAQLALAHVYRYLGQFEQAEENARCALALARLAGNQHHEGESLYLLAMITDDRGEFAVASDYGDEALALIEALGNQRLRAAILSTMSLNQNSLGHFDRAKSLAEQALQINRQMGDEMQIGRQLNNLGLLAMNLGNLVEAKSYYEQSLAVDRRLGSYLKQGVVLGNLGDVAMSMGDFFQAEAYYEAGMAIRREVEDLRGVAWMLCSLSLLAGKRERYEAGVGLGKEALAVLDVTKEQAKMGYAWTHLGHAYSGLGQLEEAKVAYKTGLAVRRELGQGHLTVVNVAGLAEIALWQNDLSLAEQLANRLLSRIERGELGGTRESGRVAWSCYQVLARLGDGRKVGVLETAVSQIQAVAQRIRNKNQRRDYLNNVLTHRHLLAAATALTHT
ncbi:MAG: tetratricopeptide repeat protein, partial [Chloroflexota bacterium]